MATNPTHPNPNPNPNSDPPCSLEALSLLNCVTDKPYDPERCIALLSVLRSCVEKKNVIRFSLAKDGTGSSPATQPRTSN